MQKKNQRDQLKYILEQIQALINSDAELRKQFGIENKFRFVKDRLQQLLTHIETAYKDSEVIVKKHKEAATDEIQIYIYLFNVQGILVRSWQNMLSQKQFNEYVFNRPIYKDKRHIEALVRSKQNKVQHAYLTVAIKEDQILRSLDKPALDPLGNPLVKVKEASLRLENLINLTHNDLVYRLNEEGELVKQET